MNHHGSYTWMSETNSEEKLIFKTNSETKEVNLVQITNLKLECINKLVVGGILAKYQKVNVNSTISIPLLI